MDPLLDTYEYEPTANFPLIDVVAVVTGKVALPALSTIMSVVEAELVSSKSEEPAVVLAPQTDSLLYGVVVPMPTRPVPDTKSPVCPLGVKLMP